MNKVVAAATILMLGSWATPAAARHADACRPRWVAAWASAQFQPDAGNAMPPGSFAGNTLRQIIRTSLDGRRLRVRLSNLAGSGPLAIAGASIAPAPDPARPVIDPAGQQRLTFAGRPGVIVPAGAEYLSDPVAMPVGALSNLAISLHYASEPAAQTSHPGSRATSYLAAGDHLSDPALEGARTVDHWFNLAGLDVEHCGPAAVLVALGDSITDGRGAITNANTRWTDFLAERLRLAPGRPAVAVLNLGIGGNRVLEDGLGPNALARFDRDVLAQPGVTHLVVLEGINDIGVMSRNGPVEPEAHAALVRNLCAAYAQLVARAHAHRIKVIGGTILPFAGSDYYHPDAASEADRQAVNRWIRTPGHFDAVIDFDAMTRDPARPDRLLPALDSGDGLHPGPQGYRTMASGIPIDLFTRR